MENQSDPEKSSPEQIRPTYVRPPGLEFAMGVALFALILVAFSVVQLGIFFTGLLERSPEFTEGGFSFALFDDPRFQARITELQYHGDLIAPTAFWSGLVGMILVLGTVSLWKRRNMAVFLGLFPPRFMQLAKWFGIFFLLVLVIQLVSSYIPGFDSDFMEQVKSTSSNTLLLFLGVAIMAPLFEEFLLRGLLYGSIRHMADEHIAVALTAGVFTMMHMQYSSAVLLLILPMGVVLGYSRSRTGSIWVPVILHVVNNSLTILIPS